MESTVTKHLRSKALTLPALLIFASCTCNIAALSLPFMTLRKGLLTEAYSLPHSVTMLWGKGLYILAALVVAFSIIFPFAKLAVLSWVTFSSKLDDKKKSWLHRVERFGKWSMLDAFLVSIILSLASKQFLVGAKPQLGLSLFIVAILLSMTCGEILVKKHPPKHTAKDNTADGNSLVLFSLYSLSLIASLFFPFLRIEDWLLANREYSIVTLVPALWRQEAWLASLLTAIFLIATPLFAWATNLRAWLGQRKSRSTPETDYWIRLAYRWSMLDVFGLSLLIFALESDHLMSANIRWGALFLGVALLLQMLFGQSLNHRKLSTVVSKPTD